MIHAGPSVNGHRRSAPPVSSPAQMAEVLNVARSTVYRVAERFRKWEAAGLLDGREDNGQAKLDERYLATLYRLVKSNPQAHGWRRPTWIREMLVETMRKNTGVRYPTIEPRIVNITDHSSSSVA